MWLGRVGNTQDVIRNRTQCRASMRGLVGADFVVRAYQCNFTWQKGDNMKASSNLNWSRRILITQFLSVLMAIISEIHVRILITGDWILPGNEILLYTPIILLTIIFTVLIKLFLDGKWINVLMIAIPYLIYWIFVLLVSSTVYPSHTDPNDYGVGIIGLLVGFYQWVGILIASIMGTFLRRCSSGKF